MRRSRPVTRNADSVGPAAFIVISLLGIVYIVLAKLFGLDAILVTSVPVALMALYGVAIVLFRRLHLRDDQTGDNFYYMGFIFTLTSLAISLVQYGSGVEISEIVENFGVAVATTIAGIVARILFNMSRRDPAEVEHLSRLELADAARKVRRELDDVVLEFAHFRRTNQQMLAEGFEEIRAEVQKSAETASAAIEDTALAARERLDAGSQLAETERIAGELQQTAALLGEINAALADIGRTTAEMADALEAQRRLGFWARVRALFGGRRPRRSQPATQARPPVPDFAAAIETEVMTDTEAETVRDGPR